MGARVLLADDHQIVREGFRGILERGGFEVTGEAGDGMEAVRQLQKRQPDAVVMDLSMPVLNGIDAAREMRGLYPRLPIVLLTVHTDEHHVLSALRAGVRGFVTKTQAASELLTALREVLHGGTYLSPHASGAIVHAYLAGRDLPVDPLTLREREVLQLVAEGKATKEIAAALDLSVKTAEYYRSRIMSKLDIHDIAGLVRYAIQNGMIQIATAFFCTLPDLTACVALML